MSYCLNPSCQKPQNLDQVNFCLSCGTKLVLKDRYRAIEPIGEGGFGRTFLAKDAHRLNALCAIKQFLPAPQILGSSEAIAKATLLFEQEARQLLQLGEQHPQIPTLFAYFEHDKRLYLVQQYIQGQDLFQELAQQGAFNEQQIYELLNDLLPILQFIHEHQVIHRDIKPTNIIRRRTSSYQGGTSGGQLVLIDFGIAKQLTRGTILTGAGTKAGTEGYAPIEQLRGGKAYPASDLYSLGVTCIHLLTNAELHELYDPLEGCWRWQEYLQQRGKDVCFQLSQVIDKLLKDYVKERYQSAEQVLKDVNATRTPPQILSPTWRCVHTLTGHSDWVNSVVISPDGQTLVSGSWDNTIKVWQLADGKLINTLEGHSDWVNSVVISQDGQIIVSGSNDNTINIWQLTDGRLIDTLEGHSDLVRSVAISPDGRTLVSGSSDNTIKIWHVDSGELIHTLEGHLDLVRSVAISPNGQILVSGSSDNTIKIWQINSGKLIQAITGHSSEVNSIVISPDGQSLISSSWDNTIKIWDLNSGKLIHILTGHLKSVNSIAISLNGKTLVSGSHDETIKIWQPFYGKLIHTIAGHSNTVFSVAVSPDGQTIASGSGDNTIKIWRRN